MPAIFLALATTKAKAAVTDPKTARMEGLSRGSRTKVAGWPTDQMSCGSQR